MSEQYRDYGGMKLGPIVVEKSWKSKSYNDAPFHKIPLKSQSLNSKNWKRAKLKIWHHFYYKKAFSYSWFCKRNLFLMHRFQTMIFFLFSQLHWTEILWKNQSSCQKFEKLNLPHVYKWFMEFFEYFDIFPISPYLIHSQPYFFDKIAVFGQIGSIGHFSHSILVTDFNFSFKIEKRQNT